MGFLPSEGPGPTGIRCILTLSRRSARVNACAGSRSAGDLGGRHLDERHDCEQHGDDGSCDERAGEPSDGSSQAGGCYGGQGDFKEGFAVAPGCFHKLLEQLDSTGQRTTGRHASLLFVSISKATDCRVKPIFWRGLRARAISESLTEPSSEDAAPPPAARTRQLTRRDDTPYERLRPSRLDSLLGLRPGAIPPLGLLHPCRPGRLSSDRRRGWRGANVVQSVCVAGIHRASAFPWMGMKERLNVAGSRVSESAGR